MRYGRALALLHINKAIITSTKDRLMGIMATFTAASA
jgi:hypothetical protein